MAIAAGVVMGLLAIIGAAFLVVTIVKAPATPSTLTINGDLSARSCYGTGDDADINPGTAVTVADPTGKIVGTGVLGQGFSNPSGGLLACTFPFAVDGVPEASDGYSIEVSHRGKLTYTSEQIRNGDVHLSIGGSL